MPVPTFRKPTRGIVKPTVSGSGFYFNIVSPNNRVIATSEVYTRKADAKRGAARVLDRGYHLWVIVDATVS